MSNISELILSTPLLAIFMIILALFLGVIFYLWSLQILKKIELMISKMKHNADNLEYLSQYIYETTYFKLKESKESNSNEEGVSSGKKMEWEEIKRQMQQVMNKQNEIDQKLNQREENPEKKVEIYSNKDKIFSQSFPAGEEGKYQNISALIVTYLKDLLQGKEQVTAQDLVYAMPSQYSLADIYRTLEIMKERNQIYWEDKSINPQSVLRLP